VAYPPKIQEFLDTLSFFPDRADRIQALIEIADQFQPVPDDVATRPYPEEKKVPGCESEVYVFQSGSPDALAFHFAVENPQGVSAKAMAAILSQGLNGLSAGEVAKLNDQLVYEVFGRELSMGKSMGLMGMVRSAIVLAEHAR
jgi:cysteine desulfuration protein SufE